MIALITLFVAATIATVAALGTGLALAIGQRVPPLAIAAALGLPLAVTHTVLNRATVAIESTSGTVNTSWDLALAPAEAAAATGAWVIPLTLVPGLLFLLLAAIAGARRGPRRVVAPIGAIVITFGLIVSAGLIGVDLTSIPGLVFAGSTLVVGVLTAVAMLSGGDGAGRHAGAAAGVVAAIVLTSVALGTTQMTVEQVMGASMSAPADVRLTLFVAGASYVAAHEGAVLAASAAGVVLALLGASCMAGAGRLDRWQGLVTAALTTVLLATAGSTSLTLAVLHVTEIARRHATPRWTVDMQPPTLEERAHGSSVAELVSLNNHALVFQGREVLQLTGSPPTLASDAIVDAKVAALADAVQGEPEPVNIAVHKQVEARALAAVALTLVGERPVSVYISRYAQIPLSAPTQTPLYARMTPTSIADLSCKPTPCTGASFPYNAWKQVLVRAKEDHTDQDLAVILVAPGVTSEAALAAAAVAHGLGLRVAIVPFKG